MKKFLLKCLLFLSLVGTLIFSITVGLPLPENCGHNFSCAYSFIDKNILLKNTKGPRLIFLGGSNLFMGLNSKRIEDSIKLNTINASLIGHVGLKFMLTNIKKYINEGDKIILSMEYLQFYGKQGNGGMELLSIITDVSHAQIRELDLDQYIQMAKSIIPLAAFKLKGIIHDNNPFKPHKDPSVVRVYDRRAFNKYGDEFVHWDFPKDLFLADAQTLNRPYDDDAMQAIISFRDFIHKKNAELFITFPCFQDLSFDKEKSQIDFIEKQYKKYGFKLISTPERYKMADSLMYDGPYHLNKKGVDKRTSLMIEDLKKLDL